MTKPISEYPNEIVQFITQINTSQPPNNQALYQGSNNRYTGTLANATFLQSVPIGTPMAVRQINAQNTSSSAVGFVTIPWAENFTFNANIEPLGIINFTTTFAFHTDAITNQLPSSATLTNTDVNYVMIDYYFDYSIECVFDNTYTITTSGSTTYINFNGYGFIYFYTNQNLPIANETINFTQSNTQYTISPTSGTSNSNGQVPFTISEILNSTTTFPSNTITASSDIAGISKSASTTVSPTFDFTNSMSPAIVYNPTSYNGGAEVIFNQNTSLTGNIIAYSVTIESGVTLTTNGYSIICNSNFINNGTINTGSGTAGGAGGSNGSSAGNGTSITTSYGGSGGGGGGSGGVGGSTEASGGGTNGGNGSTPSAPTLSNSTIQTWFNNGMQNYLEGAGGGGGESAVSIGAPSSGGNGGNGGGGIYIQATNITAGTINANGQNGGNGWHSGSGSAGGGGGGGGGGSILFAYSGSYTAGTYNTSGGTGGSGSNAGNGGAGGNGLVLTYQYTTPPISAPNLTATATIQTTQATPEPIPNQTVNFTISGSGPASFSSTSSVLTTSATTNSNGQATVTIYNANGTNTLTASCTIANITQTAQITI